MKLALLSLQVEALSLWKIQEKKCRNQIAFENKFLTKEEKITKILLQVCDNNNVGME